MEPNRIVIYDLIGGHGGMDYYCLSMAAGMIENGIETVYLTNDESMSFQIKGLRRHDVFGGLWRAKGLYRLHILFVGILKGIYYIIKYRVHGIHFHVFRFSVLMFFLIVFHRIFGSIIITIHDVNSFRGGDSKIIRKLIFLMANKIHVHNDYTAEEISRQGKLKTPIFQVAHCDYSLFYNRLPVNTFDENRKIRLLFFGQIKKVKGLDIFLKALKNLDSDKFEVKIRGKLWHDDRLKYEILLESLRDRDIDYNFEYVPDNQVIELYKWCDLVILPYRKIYQSGVLLKSLTFGKPVVVSDLQPFLDVVKSGENGLIFRNEDVMNLTELLDAVTEEDIFELASSICNGNNRLVNWISFGKDLKGIYDA